MFRFTYLLAALILCSTIPLSATAAAKRPADVWNYYHFNGSAFVSGASSDGSTYLALCENVQPVVVNSQTMTAMQTPLPDGAGVIAGICYQQSFGGKLGGGGTGFKPCFRAALQIAAGGKELVTAHTDDKGYFVVVLPAGKYSIGIGSIKAKISVERGMTTLLPLRTGKRMVD